jgi:RimJ/RimL family protein N-acetyltransferase
MMERQCRRSRRVETNALPAIPTIATARLLLRPATSADLDSWAERIFGDPEVVRYVPPPVTDARARAERMLAYFATTWELRGHGEWLVVDRADGQLVGHCGLGYLADTHEVEVDYALARAYWGRGIASEAVGASLRYGFEVVGLDRVIGLVVPEHTASRRVLEKAGFVYGGEASYFGRTLATYALLREQFRPAAGPYRVLGGEP